MIKKLTSTLWGIVLLTIVYFSSMSLVFEYIINRGDFHPLIIIFTTLGSMGCTYYFVSIVFNFIYNSLKEKKND
jgi:hypothetical protein